MDINGVDPAVAAELRSTGQKSATRACFTLRVRPDLLAEYLEVHQHVWGSMRRALRSSGWHNYSLFVDPNSGMVVGYFEANDVEAAQDAMASTEVNARWQNEMSRYFLQPNGSESQPLFQYFYLL